MPELEVMDLAYFIEGADMAKQLNTRMNVNTRGRGGLIGSLVGT